MCIYKSGCSDVTCSQIFYTAVKHGRSIKRCRKGLKSWKCFSIDKSWRYPRYKKSLVYWSHNEGQGTRFWDWLHRGKSVKEYLLDVAKIRGWRTCVAGIIVPQRIFSEWFHLGFRSWYELPAFGQRGRFKKRKNTNTEWVCHLLFKEGSGRSERASK